MQIGSLVSVGLYNPFHARFDNKIQMLCCVDSVLSIKVKVKAVNCRNSIN